MLRHLCALMVPALLVAADPAPSALVWDLATFKHLQAPARAGAAPWAPVVARLRQEADAYQKHPLDAVTDKVARGVVGEEQNPHDYRSVSIYYWPDPANPQAPWVKRDGDQNRKEMERYDAPAIARAMRRIRDASLAWWFTGQERYAADAVAQVRRWFLDPETAMTPHMDFAQFIPGQHEGRGNAHGLIDGRYFVEMLAGVRLLEESQQLSAAEQAGLRTWFASYLTWLTTSELGRKEGSAKNNHALYYDLQVATFALYTGQRDMAKDVLAQVGPRRLASQIAVDGSLPEELSRPIAGTYLCFALEAVAQMIALEHHEQVGTSVWSWASEDGRSMRAALHWLEPYIADDKAWEFGRASDAPKSERVSRILQILAASGVATGMEGLLTRFPLESNDPLRLTAHYGS